jgi:hypothetical protein
VGKIAAAEARRQGGAGQGDGRRRACSPPRIDELDAEIGEVAPISHAVTVEDDGSDLQVAHLDGTTGRAGGGRPAT